MTPPDGAEHAAISDVVRRLQTHFATTDPEHVRAVVHSHHDRVMTAGVRSHVPVLVEHAARSSLDTRPG